MNAGAVRKATLGICIDRSRTDTGGMPGFRDMKIRQNLAANYAVFRNNFTLDRHSGTRLNNDIGAR